MLILRFSHDASAQAQGKGRILILKLLLASARFHGEISALMLGLVLASLVKTRLYAVVKTSTLVISSCCYAEDGKNTLVL